jgi:iron complex outermembrane receptor protein
VLQLEGDSPAHTAVIRSSFSLPPSVELDMTLRYVSDLPDQKVPAYCTADLRIGRRISGNFNVSAAGQNLLQPSHLEYGGDPCPLVGIKRSVYLKVTWTR